MKTPFESFIESLSQKIDRIPNIQSKIPFLHAYFNNMESFPAMQKLITAKFEYEEKYTDLYQMFQTREIQINSIIKDISDIFLIEPLDNIVFFGVVLSSQIYLPGSYLLCHDDQLDDRLFAFVFYLHDTKNLKEEDGGALDLFSCDVLNSPNMITKKIIPQSFSLSIFEVSPKSFHQVSEVIRPDFKRRSIGGWILGRYDFDTYQLSVSELELLCSQVKKATLNGKWVEYLDLNANYYILDEGFSIDDISPKYFYVQYVKYNEFSFNVDFTIVKTVEYYIISEDSIKSRLVNISLETTSCSHVYRILPEETFSPGKIINPGKGTFIIIICQKRQ